ncbi:aminotransferase class IV [Flavobacterium pallidum]|uniref:branched-chain-amino-acid transaminase n=1 Tax=Flavobacterium pallidum TaxID=2172098 RepID=A0A2S1SL25_9FLAO|nr:aminotransferase class IV [Flavobacterium pallidum]AWI27105.1 aminotransferase class IV [Flavobacterium pallidum]
MVNFNGTIFETENAQLAGNRGFLYGDAVFETLKILDGRILFSEDHYFRLMASMRVVRMEIPMNFTLEYFEEQVLTLANAENCSASARARITVYRNDGGRYLPEDHNVSFLISVSKLENPLYQIGYTTYEVDLYKDFYVARQLLSGIKSTNRLLNVAAAIYAKENDLQNCLLLNDEKNVIEAVQGNVFMLTDGKLVTPPVSEGCVNGVMRRQVLALAKKMEHLEVLEQVISPFDLQKADEIFITNIIIGIQPVSKYRKKEFGSSLAQTLLQKLNTQIRLG